MSTEKRARSWRLANVEMLDQEDRAIYDAYQKHLADAAVAAKKFAQSVNTKFNVYYPNGSDGKFYRFRLLNGAFLSVELKEKQKPKLTGLNLADTERPARPLTFLDDDDEEPFIPPRLSVIP